jgi:hypothetical protein
LAATRNLSAIANFLILMEPGRPLPLGERPKRAATLGRKRVRAVKVPDAVEYWR